MPNAAISGLEYIIENLQKRAVQIYKDEGDLQPMSATAPATATTTATTGTTQATSAVPLSSSSSISLLKNVMDEFDVYSNVLSIKTKEVLTNTALLDCILLLPVTHHIIYSTNILLFFLEYTTNSFNSWFKKQKK